MKMRLLPSNLIAPKEIQSLTSYLINDAIAVDGGSLGFALSMENMRRVRNVILTHTHLDHIASLPIFISDSYPLLEEAICLYAIRESIECLRKHIFNNQIWPDFEQIRLLNGRDNGIRFVEIVPGIPFRIMDLQFTALQTNHTVPTVGLAIEEESAAIILTSDTYVSEELWQKADLLEKLQAIFVDVSYPNELAALAESSKHLTPEKLDLAMRSLRRKVPVYAVHIKSHYREPIARQLHALGHSNLYIGEIGHDYQFPSAQAPFISPATFGIAGKRAQDIWPKKQ